jgi:hypothetical protein
MVRFSPAPKSTGSRELPLSNQLPYASLAGGRNHYDHGVEESMGTDRFAFSFVCLTFRSNDYSVTKRCWSKEDHMKPSSRFLTVTLFISILNLRAFSQEKISEIGSAAPFPRLEVTGGTTFDFGDIYRGQKATHLFTIKNSGNDTLLIRNVSASCGCTAAMASKNVVPAKSTSRLNVTFNSEGYGGRVHKTVTIESNDPINPTQQVNITANVLPVLAPSPTYLFIPRAKVDSVTLSSVILTNVTQKPVTILGVETTLDGLEVEVQQKALKPSEKTDLRVSYKPTKPGPSYGDIVLKTDFEIQPTVSLHITANAYK